MKSQHIIYRDKADSCEKEDNYGTNFVAEFKWYSLSNINHHT
jgi:hypothetical protein